MLSGRGGGSTPLSLKNLDFFLTKYKKYSAYHEYFFFVKTIFFNVNLCFFSQDYNRSVGEVCHNPFLYQFCIFQYIPVRLVYV